MSEQSQTGLFYRKSTKDYVLLWQNREIAVYDSIEAFVDSHQQGLQAMEANQAELLANLYKSP